LARHNFTVESTPGKVPDPGVSAFHRDLNRLTARQVSVLAELIMTTAELHRLTRNNARKALRVSLEAGDIQMSDLSASIADKLTSE